MNLKNNKALLIPLLPLALILVISSLNLGYKSRLKILIWQTPELSLGIFMGVGTTIGFISSFIILNTGNNTYTRFNARRKVHKGFDNNTELKNKYNEQVEIEEENNNQYIERDLRDPSPTIAVQYKVVKKANDSSFNYSSNDDLNTTKNYTKKYKSSNTDSIEDWSYTDFENW